MEDLKGLVNAYEKDLIGFAEKLDHTPSESGMEQEAADLLIKETQKLFRYGPSDPAAGGRSIEKCRPVSCVRLLGS